LKRRHAGSAALAVLLVTSGAAADAGRTISLLTLSDLHGHLAPHPAVFTDGRVETRAGGVAKLATLVRGIRRENPATLVMLVGDATHGSAETTFTLGDAIMPALNSLGIDVYLPGNWDFGWGPRVYRQRFTADTATPLSANNRTTLAWMDGRPDHEGQTCRRPGDAVGYPECHVTKAKFPAVAINLYDYDERGRRFGSRLHDPYVIREIAGVRVAVIGITSDSVPHQAHAFNVGLRFTMGYEELPGDIAAARADGAHLVVVLSELGLAKSVALARDFPAIDVILSAHTHERTAEPIVIRHDDGGATLVVEAGEDEYLGRLDVTVDAGTGEMTDWRWALVAVDGDVPEDAAIRALVERERAPFLAGPQFSCHTFGPSGFPFGKGHTLCEPLDAVVGHTGPTLQRLSALEAIVNNANVDAFLEFARFVDPGLDAGNTLATTNGFRFDVTIPGADDGFSGDITIGDLYSYYPIGAAFALADVSGGRLVDHWEDVLANVFDPDPYRQRGGWFLGFTRNLHFDLRLDSRAPALDGGRRIQRVTIDDGNGPDDIDRGKIYTLASCYPHGNPVDEVCRTSGAQNTRFISGTRESAGPADLFGNRQLDMRGDAGTFHVVAPEHAERIFDSSRSATFLKVAPDDFVHPVDALRWYLRDGLPGARAISGDAHGLGRIGVVGADPEDPRGGVPESALGGPDIIQPVQGAGASWLFRGATSGARTTP